MESTAPRTASSIDLLRERVARGRDLLSKDDDLERLESGVFAASEAAGELHRMVEDAVLDPELILAIEDLIQSTAKSLPLLQALELELLEALSDGAPASDVPKVRRLAEAHGRSITATQDLERGVARAYQRYFEQRDREAGRSER